MTKTFLIMLTSIVSVIMSCGQIDNSKPHYIKVLVFGQADSVNNFNKGVRLAFYSYMDLNSDSVIYRFISDIVPEYKYTTYTAKIKNLKENDSIANAIDALTHIKNGIIQETVQFEPHSTYCGPELYIEYKDGSKEKYVYFLQSNLDKRLEVFTDYFFDLQSDYWTNNIVSNDIIDVDSIAISAIKRLGLYDSIPMPKTALAK